MVEIGPARSWKGRRPDSGYLGAFSHKLLAKFGKLGTNMRLFTENEKSTALVRDVCVIRVTDAASRLFAEGVDIHAGTAAGMFGISLGHD